MATVVPDRSATSELSTIVIRTMHMVVRALPSIALALLATSASANSGPKDSVNCGKLRAEIGQAQQATGRGHTLQIFLDSSQTGRPVLPYTYSMLARPGTGCLAGTVPVAVFSGNDAHDYAVVAFDDGTFLLVSADTWEFRDDVGAVPLRPRLPLALRESVPTAYRELFDFD